jgi:transcriptional regulator
VICVRAGKPIDQTRRTQVRASCAASSRAAICVRAGQPVDQTVERMFDKT